jgi:acyl-ACP thioesterase
MAEPPAVELVPPPAEGRIFESRRVVRFGDVDRHGHVRLDALATYLQDVAGDDTDEVGLRDLGGWVVRRTVFEVVRPPRYGQVLTLRTWASGSGSRWAERRMSVTAPGAQVESASLWVYVDPASLRPAPLAEGFRAVYTPATGGRSVSSRFQHDPAPDPDRAREQWPWAVRATDIDLFAHVNNAATWAIVEEALASAFGPPGRADRPSGAPRRAELEYRTPIGPGAAVTVEAQAGDAALGLWVRDAGTGALYATARVVPRPG